MTAATDEIEMLRLPCGHLATKPQRLTSIVACHCGRLWQLIRSRGEWTARDAENL